jgi:hypothetical protein
MRGRPGIWAFVAWAVVGAGACAGVLAILTIGIFVLLLTAAVLTLLLLWPGGRTVAAVGTISGAGLMPLYVAYLNRGGPGEVCHAIPGGQECNDAWSPWPWLGVGLVLVAAGIAAFAALRSR